MLIKGLVGATSPVARGIAPISLPSPKYLRRRTPIRSIVSVRDTTECPVQYIRLEGNHNTMPLFSLVRSVNAPRISNPSLLSTTRIAGLFYIPLHPSSTQDRTVMPVSGIDISLPDALTTVLVVNLRKIRKYYQREC